MKRVLLTLNIAILLGLPAFATGVIVIEGNYQGRNLYVQNPFASSGVGFCTFEVTVNDDVTTDEINSSAFEVDLSNFQLNLGDPVVVKIKHKDDCKPKVLNPEVLKPKSTFKVGKMEVTSDGVLKWTTTEETGKLPYIVEQYRWNKWVKVGEVEGKGAEGEHSYEFKISDIIHSGENQFRVKQIDYTGKPKLSQSTKYVDTKIPEVTFKPKTVKKVLEFTNETMFEVYDQYGNIVKKGFSGEIDCINLDKGIYYLNYDNKMDTFIKK